MSASLRYGTKPILRSLLLEILTKGQQTNAAASTHAWKVYMHKRIQIEQYSQEHSTMSTSPCLDTFPLKNTHHPGAPHVAQPPLPGHMSPRNQTPARRPIRPEVLSEPAALSSDTGTANNRSAQHPYLESFPAQAKAD